MHLRRSILSLVAATMISGGTVLGFSPVLAGAATAPTVQVQPSTNLADGQAVTVTGTGFTPTDTLGVFECQAGATSAFNCDLNTLVFTVHPADSNGDFSTPYVVSRSIQPLSSPPLDCSVPGACVLGVSDPGSSEFASTPLTFNPTAPFPPTLDFGATLSPTGTVNHKTGVATLSGTVTCNRPVIVTVAGGVGENSHHVSSSGGFQTSVLCTSSSTWSAVIQATSPFTKGILSITSPYAIGSPSAETYGTSRPVNPSGPVTLNFSKS